VGKIEITSHQNDSLYRESTQNHRYVQLRTDLILLSSKDRPALKKEKPMPKTGKERERRTELSGKKKGKELL